MILGSLPFTLYVATLRGHRLALLKDHQVHGFIGFLAVTWLVFAFWLWLNSDYGWWDALRLVAVNVTSVVTTTGFALTDYTTWEPSRSCCSSTSPSSAVARAPPPAG